MARRLEANALDASAAAAAMQTDGYVYTPQWPHGWEAKVAEAAACIDNEVLGQKQKRLEAINSNRLELKLPRSVEALPVPIRRCVVELERWMKLLCAGDYVLQDCYALLTPADETDAEARAPQRWHLDAVKRFPVAALLLRGSRPTEFAVGPYSDFSDGVPAATLERWTLPLKDIHARTWESESVEEWAHFQQHLHAAQLVTGTEEDECGQHVEACDWSALRVAPSPADAGVSGGSSIFWSNKVHRGPGTLPGEERVVLFCSWIPREARHVDVTKSKESETDYSFYDTHLEPKLRLSQRSQRSIKRASGDALGKEQGPRQSRRRG